MNRIFPRHEIPTKTNPNMARPLAPSTKRLRTEAEAILRDVAYVLSLTQRVKADILGNRELTETAMA